MEDPYSFRWDGVGGGEVGREFVLSNQNKATASAFKMH